MHRLAAFSCFAIGGCGLLGANPLPSPEWIRSTGLSTSSSFATSHTRAVGDPFARVIFSLDHTVHAIAPGGGVLWTRTLADNTTARYALTVDPAGNIYVAGSGDVGPGVPLLSKLSPSGGTVWTRTVSDTKGTAVVVDDQGAIYVAGSIKSPAGPHGDLYLAKYSSDGVEQWTRRFAGSADQPDTATGLVAMPGGGVVVTGVTYNSDEQFITLRYSAAGSAQWIAFYNEPGVASEPFGIVRTSDGGVAVAGSSGPRTVATVKYSGSGAPLWVNRTDLSAAANAASAAVRGISPAPLGGAVVLGSVVVGSTAEVSLLQVVSASPPVWKTPLRSVPSSNLGTVSLTDLPGGGWVAASGQNGNNQVYLVFSCVDAAGAVQNRNVSTLVEGMCSSLTTGSDGAVWALTPRLGDLQIRRYGPTFMAAPEAVTAGYDSLETTSVRLKGTVNPHLGDTTYFYEYGPTITYGSTTPGRTLPIDSIPRDAFEPGVSVSPGTTYHFRIVASNSSGTSYGADQTFTTPQTAYQQWTITHFGGLSAPDSEPTDDPDLDGIVNLAEFAFGGAPLVGGIPPGYPEPQMWESPDSGFVFHSIVYRPDPAATGITITPVASNDLVSWTTSGVVVIDQVDGSKRAVAQGLEHFMRLQITMP